MKRLFALVLLALLGALTAGRVAASPPCWAHHQTCPPTTTTTVSTTTTTTTVPTTTTTTPTTSGGQTGIGITQYGGSLGNITSTHLDLYSMVIGDAWDHISTLQTVPGRGLAYFNGTDLKQSYSTGVTYTQAYNNGWILYCGTSYCKNSTFSAYGADLGNTSYQQAWIKNVLAYLAKYPGIDGIFIDNVLYDPKADFGGIYPNKYPTTSSWDVATLSFVKAVYSALHAKGYYVAENAGAYKSGDSLFNTGTSTVNWWKQIGAAGVDGLMNENYNEASVSGAWKLRSMGSYWYQHWDGWQILIPTAQSMGKDFIGLSSNCSTCTTAMVYDKASFLLGWNGGGSVFMYHAGSSDPTNSAWTSNVGAPAGSKFQVGVGWERPYTKATVLVNPAASSQTFVVSGVSYTLSPVTARIILK